MTKDRNAESRWKQIFRGYLPDAMDFFFLKISREIDWRSPPVFLDKDLEQLDPDDVYGQFMAFKLVDYRERWEELESSSNPFSMVVMAHLKAEELKNDPQEMKNWKFLLVRRLYERGYNKRQIKDLSNFIDQIMVLPEELNNSFLNDLRAYGQEKKMDYITRG